MAGAATVDVAALRAVTSFVRREMTFETTSAAEKLVFAPLIVSRLAV